MEAYFTETTYGVICDPDVLGNRIHTQLIYHGTNQLMKDSHRILRQYLEKNNVEALTKLQLNNETRRILEKYLSLSDEDHWAELTYRYFEGLDTLLVRELKQSEEVVQPKDLEERIKHCFYILSENDLIEYTTIQENIVEINYIALGTHSSGLKYSPNYRPGDFEIGLFRDTQLTFVLNFETGLLGWLYLNIQPELRSQGIGTRLVKAVEEFACSTGFHRFSVEWPNREYWMKYLHYPFNISLRFEQENYGYTIEMYKEIP